MRTGRYRARRAGIVPALLLTTLMLSACNPFGDEDAGDANGDGGTTGGIATDEEYMRDMCESTVAFLDDVYESVLPAMMQADQEAAERDALEAARRVFDGFVQELRTMDTPEDVRPYHDQLVEAYARAVERLDEGDFGALDTIDADFTLPGDTRERLEAAAADIDACELDLF